MGIGVRLLYTPAHRNRRSRFYPHGVQAKSFFPTLKDVLRMTRFSRLVEADVVYTNSKARAVPDSRRRDLQHTIPSVVFALA